MLHYVHGINGQQQTMKLNHMLNIFILYFFFLVGCKTNLFFNIVTSAGKIEKEIEKSTKHHIGILKSM